MIGIRATAVPKRGRGGGGIYRVVSSQMVLVIIKGMEQMAWDIEAVHTCKTWIRAIWIAAELSTLGRVVE